MADFPEDDSDKERREEAVGRRLGVERWYYLQAIQAAVAFTNAAPADPNPRQWRQWGARNLGGRIRSLAQDPRNPSTIYAGSAQGGVFRSDDGGDTWRSLGLPGDSFPVGALALAPSDSTVLYVGTGEPAIIHDPVPPAPAPPVTIDGREAAAAGLGLFRCDTSTGTFTNEVGPAIPLPGPVGAANSYAAIAVDPHQPDRCWIASHTGLWRREPVAPRFRREPIPAPAPQPVAPRLGACVSDVVLVENWDQNQPTTYRLFAAVAGVGIFRGVFTPGPAPGMAWDPILTGGLPAAGGLPAVVFDRIRLAVCKAYPNHVYAVLENRADHSILSIFHSVDGGTNWTARAVPPNLGNQAWSDLCIAVHPNNPGVVIVGNVNVARSLDFGVHWDLIIDWVNHTSVDRAQHGDNHVLLFDVREPNSLWVGNDGGISFTPDVVNANPLTASTWRKRSHGLCVSQFNDITVHPDYPFMMGGGLQDNATYLTFGGQTWAIAGGGDGGQMCFEVRDPRNFMAPNQPDNGPPLNHNNLVMSSIVSGASATGGEVRSSIADVAVPNDVIAMSQLVPGGAATVTLLNTLLGLFVQNVLHHPRDARNLMAGRFGDIVFSTNAGSSYTAGGAAVQVAGADVPALAYGPGATAAISDWWIGTGNGVIARGDGGAIPKVWTNVTPPLPAPGLVGIAVTAVAVHPNNNNYVVACTGGNAAAVAPIVQGRVFLSNNRGGRWMEITGLAAAFDLSGAPPGGPVAGTRNPLPPCPLTSLAFDPTVAAASPQVLYVGTLAGVYVIRNLPPLPAGPPPPIAAPAPFNPDWRTFNGPAAAPLPLTLVNDLEIATLPPRPGAAANSPESMLRLRLYAAMFGRAIFVSDISPAYPAGVPAGGPPRRLVIRQHAIEDGLAYPRPTPTVLNTAPAAPSYNQPQLQGDPRLPPIPSPIPVPPPIGAFNDHTAMDIRVDNAPFQFFDEVLDGVEFDEELRTKNLVPGQVNAIYVQVQNTGWDRFAQPVDVHLFFAAGAAPAAGADPAPLPDLHDNFWSNFTVEPQLPPAAGALAPGAAQWQRTGKKQSIPANRLSAAYPAVVRFEWTPPVSLAAAGFTALLAVCTNPEDPLPAPAAMPLVMRNLIRQERRTAFRLVTTDPYTPDVYIRDSVDDTGGAASGSFAGRSPDIIVVQSAVTPETEFKDLLDTHNGDRIRPGVPQIIYVRVTNRRNVPVAAKVDLLWARPNAATSAADAHAPGFDGTKWTAVTPLGTTSVNVPANGSAFATITWPAADVPPADAAAGAFNAIGFAALVSSLEGARDPAPAATRVRDAASFWDFFARTADSNNAAFRAVLYGDGG